MVIKVEALSLAGDILTLPTFAEIIWPPFIRFILTFVKVCVIPKSGPEEVNRTVQV